MCKCKNIEIGSYGRQVSMKDPFVKRNDGWVCIDICICQEIAELWYLGIRTNGCCCGHNKQRGYIGVYDEDIEKMKELGYEQQEHFQGQKNNFTPKTIKNI